MCLGNILNNFTIDNMKKTGWKSIGKAFSADYNAIDTNYFLDFHRNSMKGTWPKIVFRFVSKNFIGLLISAVNAYIHNK